MTSFPPAPPGTNDQLSPIRSSRPERLLQGRTRPRPRAHRPLEDRRGPRARDARLGPLAQHATAPRLPRRRPTGRVREHDLCCPSRPRTAGRNQIARVSIRPRALQDCDGMRAARCSRWVENRGARLVYSVSEPGSGLPSRTASQRAFVASGVSIAFWNEPSFSQMGSSHLRV